MPQDKRVMELFVNPFSIGLGIPKLSEKSPPTIES